MEGGEWIGKEKTEPRSTQQPKKNKRYRHESDKLNKLVAIRLAMIIVAASLLSFILLFFGAQALNARKNNHDALPSPAIPFSPPNLESYSLPLSRTNQSYGQTGKSGAPCPPSPAITPSTPPSLPTLELYQSFGQTGKSGASSQYKKPPRIIRRPNCKPFHLGKTGDENDMLLFKGYLKETGVAVKYMPTCIGDMILQYIPRHDNLVIKLDEKGKSGIARLFKTSKVAEKRKEMLLFGYIGRDTKMPQEVLKVILPYMSLNESTCVTLHGKESHEVIHRLPGCTHATLFTTYSSRVGIIDFSQCPYAATHEIGMANLTSDRSQGPPIANMTYSQHDNVALYDLRGKEIPWKKEKEPFFIVRCLFCQVGCCVYFGVESKEYTQPKGSVIGWGTLCREQIMILSICLPHRIEPMRYGNH